MSDWKKAPFTIASIALNLIVFVAGFAYPQLDNMLALSTSVFSTGEYWTLLTSAFVHSGVAHIAMNMIMLWYMGSALEGLYGSGKTVAVYLASALCGNLAFVGVNLALGTPASAVGASGAIFGLLGMYAVLLLSEIKRNRILANPPTMQSSSGFFACLALNVAIGFMPGIAWEAHFGGFVAGAVGGWLVYQATCRKYGR